jgi:3-methyladenine DNA glycosylase/8-oxoguanine DNA glycosylase
VAQRLKFSAAAAYRHLRQADPVVGDLIEAFGSYTPRASDDPLRQLLRSILYQQLAGAAARAIELRWLASYGIAAEGRLPALDRRTRRSGPARPLRRE